MAQSNEELIRFRNLTRRTLLLGGAQLALFGALGFRLHQLQVTESERFRVLSDDNRINLRLLSPKRGRILDRFGVPLAINDQNYRVVLIAEQTEGVEETLRRLGQLLPIDDSVKQRVIKEVGRNRAFVPILVMENLTWDQVSAVEINAPDLPGVSIEVGETRTYPFGDPFAHSIGYVASVSEKELQEQNDPLLSLPEFRIGKSGAEKVYDLALRGKAGNSQVEVNAYGRVIRELERDEGTPGRELVLTLDSGLQNYVHQRLMGEVAASTVVLDIVTGDVLAMASVPSYNPNSFTLGLSSQEWQALVDDPLKPLSNRTVNGLYAPGSTFKMVVALAALEGGVSPAQQVFCPGHYELGNARFHCWKKGGHGHVDMELGIKHSCDVYFYDTARRVGIDRISEVAFRLGLGAASGIDLPSEKGGVIPTRAWKEENMGEAWQGGETLVTAIGQGFVLATPLQLAVMTARLASGLAVTPHLARGFRDQGPDDPAPPAIFPALGFSEEHLAIVRQAMNRVVNEAGGTAYGSRIADVGWEMAGKTGTSQVRRISMAERAQGVTRNEDLPWHRRDHALFVAFAPVLQPRYACAVVVDHGSGGSKAAAPVARDVLTEVQRRNSAGQPALPQLAATET